MKPWCAICLSYGPDLRPRQLSQGGPLFILCRDCDESETPTIRNRPARYRHRAETRHRVYRPIDENERDMSFRILRCVQRFDWVSSIEICDALGIPGAALHRQLHNNYSVSLSRLYRKGFLRRRHVLEWHEYQITSKGLARIESCERAVVENKRSIAA